MNRQTHLLPQGFHQLLCGVRTAQAGHVLDAQGVGTHLLEFLRKLHVILERIFIALIVEDIARVTDRAFTDRVCFAYGLHRGLKVGQVIERIEDPENIHAVLGRMFHERLHDVVWIIGVPHRVGAAEEHLKTDIWHSLAQLTQALPRIFT